MTDKAALIAALMARKPVPQQWATDAAYPTAPSQISGLFQMGNINPYNRPNVKNRDGSVSTVRTMSYGTDAGETLVPTVSDEGKIMQSRDAMRYWQQKGQNFGTFQTPEDADAYAQMLHEQQAAFYGLNKR